MFKIEMPHLKRKHGTKYLYVPGGWQADMPRIQVEPCVVDAWALYLRQSGMGTLDSLNRAHEMGQLIYEAGYRPGLLSHTMHWAKQYAKSYPDTLCQVGMKNNIFSMNGFDPSVVQSGYIPFQRGTRRGQPFMIKLLGEMRG